MDGQPTPPMATPRVSAGALFTNEHNQVLLVEPTYKSHWDVPGGYVEPGESPLAACAREVKEELGIAPPLGPLLAVDWAPIEAEGDKLLFIFDGGHLRPDNLAAIRLDDGELSSFGFYDLATADQLLIPRLARRLAAALSAHQRRETWYLEHGVPVASLPS